MPRITVSAATKAITANSARREGLGSEGWTMLMAELLGGLRRGVNLLTSQAQSAAKRGRTVVSPTVSL